MLAPTGTPPVAAAVDGFAEGHSQFFESPSRIAAVYDSPEETQPRREALAISANVFLANAGVQPGKRLHAARLTEQLAGVTQVGRLRRHTVGTPSR